MFIATVGFVILAQKDLNRLTKNLMRDILSKWKFCMIKVIMNIIVLWTLCFALLRIHNGLKIKGLINEMKTLIYMQSLNCAQSRLSINLSAAGKKCEICYSIFIKFWLPEF